MSEFDPTEARSLREMKEPVVIAAFGGWSDAGNAATDAVEHVNERAAGALAWQMGEEYYDLQVTRPTVLGTADGRREIIWPAIRVHTGSVTDARGKQLDVVLLSGLEPNLRWQMFSSQLVSALRSVRPRLVVILGAMLSDQPHNLPVPISRSSASAAVRDRYGATVADYEGPTGITGVFAHDCDRAQLDTLSLWATLPHYVANSPSPKATLALLQHLEGLLDADLGLDELEPMARRWEAEVNELVESDSDLADYVATLLEDHDLDPGVSGDDLAAEFERYLRRRD